MCVLGTVFTVFLTARTKSAEIEAAVSIMVMRMTLNIAHSALSFVITLN